ncbi:hypothetical protein [Amorphus sp. 3PC139-8]|uniref:hypothetical protein n=1 Tax=Amorphus sp. 3PC139-8 TaxID=2735676 RepID=UPI00345CFD74
MTIITSFAPPLSRPVMARFFVGALLPGRGPIVIAAGLTRPFDEFRRVVEFHRYLVLLETALVPQAFNLALLL